jgi:hypothetical protein
MWRDNGNPGEGSVYLQQGKCCHLICNKRKNRRTIKEGKEYFLTQYPAVKFATFSVLCISSYNIFFYSHQFCRVFLKFLNFYIYANTL